MHHFEFNIGSYRRDTGHLTLLEHGVYRMLIDSYYMNEGPLKADDEQLMRTHCIRSADEQKAYANVMKDFFRLEDEYYVHDGCDKVLEKIFAKSQAARESAEARWARKNGGSKRTHSKRNANAMQSDSEGNANGMLPITHNPIPNTHNPNIKPTPSAPRESKLDFSQWHEQPDQQILKDWIAMRRGKKAPVSQTVINRYAKQLELACKDGHTVDECLSLSTTKGWLDFKYEWFLNEERKNGNANSNGNYKSQSDRLAESARFAGIRPEDGSSALDGSYERIG